MTRRDGRGATPGSAKPAIVLGTGIVSLGVIHDLAAEGVPVVHISTKHSDIALRSRLSSRRIVLPEAAQEPQRLLEALLDLDEDWDGACLLPTVDPMVEFVSRNLERLQERFRTPVQAWHKLDPVVDKSKLYATAHAAGVPAPRVLPVEAGSDVMPWARDVGYPILVKPRQTPAFFAAFSRKAFEAQDEAQLRSILDAVQARGLSVMVSEIIPGEVTSLYCYRAYVDRAGRVAAEMCSQKLRTHPPAYGVGRVQRTVPMIPALRDQGRRLLEALDFRGFGSVEFKQDARDGQFKLMEINPRPALCQRLFTAAGINFAHLTYLDLNGEALPPAHYDAEVYAIHNIGELYYVRGFLRRGWPGVRELLVPYRARRRTYMIPFRNDPRPLLYELRRALGGALRRRGLAGRARKRSKPALMPGETA